MDPATHDNEFTSTIAGIGVALVDRGIPGGAKLHRHRTQELTKLEQICRTLQLIAAVSAPLFGAAKY
jgi:hypothetical protein